MANPNAVNNLYLDSFGNGRIAVKQAANLSATGSDVITLPLLSGGLTNANAVVGSGEVIVRRITVNNPVGNISNVVISVTTSSDGNISNAVVANTTLSNLTGPGTYQDLTIAGGYGANTAITGYTTSALYVNVNTGSGNVANTATIAVYGDVVSF
jgi:hypothetical protein